MNFIYNVFLYKSSVFIHILKSVPAVFAILLLNISFVFSQNPVNDTIKAGYDSLKIATEDTLIYNAEGDSIKVSVKKKSDKVDAPVDYSSADSMVFNLSEKKVYLYNNAQINYKEIELKAGYIEIDFDEDEAFATGVTDSSGQETGKPQFKDGGDEFTAQTLRYNFKTKKGIITGVVTEQSGGFLHSERTKRLADGNICLKNGLYTTCDLEHPHFYVTLTKAKVIPDDKIVSGPAYLVIEDIPFPLGIPFGFFPNKKGNKSGILIPEYGEEENRGFFLKNGGYYFAISDYLDATLRGEIYSKGSWGANLVSNYKKRYKYNGNVYLSYVKLIVSEKELPNYLNTNTYWFKWNHSQDRKAHPNHTFSANVNVGSSSYNKYNTYSVENRLRSDVQSNVSFSQNWPNSPFNLSTNLRHSQNLIDSTINLSIPEIFFSVSRQQPFKSKKSHGRQNLFSNIGFSYNTNITNSIQTKEDKLFTDATLHDMRNGMKHSIPVSSSMKVLKVLMFNPSLNYTERWYVKTIRKTWIPEFETPEDTIPAHLDTDTITGFRRAGDYLLSIPFSTKFFGFYQSRSPNAKIIALRHVATPSVSYSYRPDYSKEHFGYYRTVQKDTLGNTETYTIFNNGVFGYPAAGKSGNINFALGNNLEMKVRSDKDTVSGTKKIVLLESLNFSSSYNMALDSMKWSNVNISGRTTLFKVLNVTFNGTFDPYAYDSTGRKLNMPEWKYTGSMGRLRSASISTSLSLNSDGLKTKNEPAAEKSKEAAIAAGLPPNYLDYYVDFKIPWNFSLNYNLYYSLNQYDTTKYKFSSQVTKVLGFSGDLNITGNWKFSFSTGYDLKEEKFTYTSINIYRDLHCWEMRLSWVPFGIYKSYNFQINVKSSVLQDLKLNRRRNWTENF